MSLQKDLKELLDAGIINSEIAENIQQYYQSKKPNSSHRLFIAFGVLGAILVGLGIILILAHNWDNLSRGTKTFLAFVPLLIGQGLCGYTLLKKKESITWRESSAIFVFFGVGASIALVSQIYNLPGSIASYLLTWALLCLPLIYIMRSSIVSLLYLAGITWYGVEVGYDNRAPGFNWYWLLLMAAIPYYYLLYRNKPDSNFMTFHNWMLPISLTITLGTFAEHDNELMFVAYISLFAVFYLIGNFSFLKRQSLFRNGYRIIGALGTVGVLLSLSFSWFWEDLHRASLGFGPELVVSFILSMIAVVLLVRQIQRTSIKDMEPVAPVFIVFIVIFLLGLIVPFASILINLLLFAIGLLTIRKGGRENHLGILNYGLLIITMLVFCRFFDTDLPFIWRGILFVVVGIGFFMTNYWMLKKRKANEL